MVDMKQIITYTFLLLVLISCGKEEVISTLKQGSTVKVPFSVTITSKTGGRQTKAGEYIPPTDGESAVNTLRVCVFENTSGSENFDDLAQFFYVGEGEITDLINGPTDYIAKGNITTKGGSSYLILALAYHSDYEAELKGVDVDGKKHLFAINTPLASAKLELEKYITPELFAGYLYRVGHNQEESTHPLAGLEETTQLEGHLYRAVGLVSIKLTDIPVETNNIQRLSLVTQLCPTSNDVYDHYFITNITTQGYIYPMGYVNEELSVVDSTVAIVEAKDIQNGTATLESYFFPFDKHQNKLGVMIENRTYFYIDITSEDKTVTRCLVQCQDSEWEETIWTGLYDKLIKSNSFMIKPNRQIKLSGTFETLKSGNLRIDEGVMEEAEGGELTQNK